MALSRKDILDSLRKEFKALTEHAKTHPDNQDEPPDNEDDAYHDYDNGLNELLEGLRDTVESILDNAGDPPSGFRPITDEEVRYYCTVLPPGQPGHNPNVAIVRLTCMWRGCATKKQWETTEVHNKEEAINSDLYKDAKKATFVELQQHVFNMCQDLAR